MFSRQPLPGHLPLIRRAVGRLAALLLALGILLPGAASHAQGTPHKPAEKAADKPAADEQSPKVRLMLDLLADKDVQAWLDKQREASKAAKPAEAREASLSESLSARVAAFHREFAALVAAIPTLPADLGRAFGKFRDDMQGGGLLRAIFLLIAFIVIGGCAEWLFVHLLRHLRHASHTAVPTTVRQRVAAIGGRLLAGLAPVLAFAAGSMGIFLVFEWPPLLRALVFIYLLAFIELRIVIVLLRVTLSPDNDDLRVVPMPSTNAAFWYRRLKVMVAWFAFGVATLELLLRMDLTTETVRLVASALSVVLLVIALEMVWRRPARRAADGTELPISRRVTWLLTLWLVTMWALRSVGMFGTFWPLLVVVGVPACIALTHRMVAHLLRPATDGGDAQPISSLYAVGLERGLRAAWIVAGVVVLATFWKVDLVHMATAGDSVATRLAHGVLSAVVILLIADFAWQMLRAFIDDRLIAARVPAAVDTDEARRRARLRTLLPIIRNMLFIVFLVMAVLMALAAMGVEIGPLIAGAGVIGVAVGFGAQTVVRDVISGMFYLMDDAFRVGEYIQSGNYKGTVESFSLRSIKLRHQRGALYTVPFGTLGAVQNMSRDWVIDKMMIGITYDSDPDLAKKLIKQVGKQLTEIPEFAPDILETLKMQGVENFGDFAIQIRTKMKTRPGTQFVIKRRALSLIKKAFDENGVKFAYPTVQVAGGDAATAAAAKQALAATHPAPIAAS